MSNIGYASLSGLQAADRAMKGVAHNISNVETPGYHRIETIFTEQGPFPVVAGVSTDYRRAENALLDNAMNSATLAKQFADDFSDALKGLDGLPSNTLETSYSQLMGSSQQLLRIPTDPIAQQDFNDKVSNFQNSLNAYQSQLDSIKDDLNLRVEFGQSRVDMIQQQLRDAAKAGTATPDDINFLKMQLMQATGSVDAYKKVLSSIIPPIELAFTNASQFVKDSMNQLSGQTIFNTDNTANVVTDFSTFDESNLPEWDSHWYNTELGRIKTWLGNQGQLADNNVQIATTNFDALSQQYQDEFGVDLVEEQVKSMRYQRMYEANALMIKTQDEMIGTLLSIVA